MRFSSWTPVIMIASTKVLGQGQKYGVEIFTGVGASRVGEDEEWLGSGLSFYRGLGVRFIRRVSLEGDLIHTRYDGKVSLTQLRGHATGVFGHFLSHFDEGRAQFFVMGSAGSLNLKRTFMFFPGGERTIITESEDIHFAWGGESGSEGLPDRALLAAIAVSLHLQPHSRNSWTHHRFRRGGGPLVGRRDLGASKLKRILTESICAGFSLTGPPGRTMKTGRTRFLRASSRAKPAGKMAALPEVFGGVIHGVRASALKRKMRIAHG